MSGRHSIHIATADRTLVAVDDFEIAPNRVTILLGESGIGKTLISKALYGLLDPEEFAVRIDGLPYKKYLELPETRALQAESFFVFQEPSTHLNPMMTLGEQLNEGSLASAVHQEEILRRLWSASGEADAAALLPVYPKPHRPSGGEKQRVLLAMAFTKLDLVLARKGFTHPLFVFDEPSGSLDNRYRDIFLAMLFERFRTGPFTVLLITHDYSMIGTIHERFADLLPAMTFKELASGRDGLRLRDFEPKEYLRWLHGLRPIAVDAGPPVLTIESESAIHGRTLTITRDQDGKTPCSLMLRRGMLVYLKAPSGVGKTTLVKAVMGLVRAQRLRASLNGLELTERTSLRVWRRRIWGKKMTLVFQHADEALNLESMVRSVFTGLPPLKGTSASTTSDIMRELFDEEDIPVLLRKKVKHLSGGQKQRLNLLRGLSLHTDVLILDEPLNGLDFESAGRVIAKVQQQQQAGKAILLISHNEEIFDRLVLPDCVYYLQGKESFQVPEAEEFMD